MFALSLVDLRIWFQLAYPTYALGLMLLAAVMVVGHHSLGATRWLQLGPVQIQPSEIMKIGMVLSLARYYHGISALEARLSWKLLIPAALIGLPTLLVAKQPDLGTALLLAFTGGAVMFLAGLSWKVLAAGGAAAVAGVVPFILFVLKGYQRDRVLTFLHPEQDPSGTGYHILQSKIALGSGGLLGKGFGLGTQSQLNFLPEKHTDFIFSTFAEEFGLVGCFGLLAIYGVAIAIALRIASVSHSHFGRLSAAGVTFTFALYVLINAAMVMGLTPIVGVPMPLMSYGGTVMLTVMIGFGLVQAVRVHRYEEMPSGRGTLF
jgi:rod shape determining protein RodA